MNADDSYILSGYYYSLAQYCDAVIGLKRVEDKIRDIEKKTPPAFRSAQFQHYIKMREHASSGIRTGERLAGYSWSGVFQYGEALGLRFRLDVVANFQTLALADTDFCKYVHRWAITLGSDAENARTARVLSLEDFLDAYASHKEGLKRQKPKLA